MNRTLALATAVALGLATYDAGRAATASMHAGRSEGAFPGGVGNDLDVGPGPAGRSSFRDDSHWRFAGRRGGWGFAHDGDWRGRHRRGVYLYGLPYGAYDAATDEESGSEFGPQPPMGDSFEAARRYGPPPAPLAPYLAPLAYGSGPHDGAYAYGYAGYAQTPALPWETGGLAAPVGVYGCNRC